MYFREDVALMERARLVDEMRSILDKAEDRGSMSSRDKRAVNAIESKIDAVDEQIREHREKLGIGGDGPRGAALARQSGGHATATVDGDSTVLRRGERFADWYAARHGCGTFGAAGDGLDNEADVENLSLGAVVRAMATGRRDGLSEVARRSLLESADANGGYLTPEILGARLIDRVRNAARVFQAGATTVPLESDRHSIARLDTGVTPQFRAEGDPIAESDMNFSRITFVPRFLGVLVKVSLELMEDWTPQSAQIVENEIAKAIALAVDSNALYGDGVAPHVLGVKNQAGVTLTALNAAGASPTYDNFLDAFQVLRGANFEPTATIAAPRTQRSLEALKDSTGRYLDPPASFKDVPFLTTNQVRVNEDSTDASEHDCSDAFVGQWEHLLVGFRPNIGLRIKELNERYLADEGKIGIVAYTRVDVQLAHAAAFNVLTGIRP